MAGTRKQASSWRAVIPESFTALVGGLVTACLVLLTALNREPSVVVWTFAGGCLGVGGVTTLLGKIRATREETP